MERRRSLGFAALGVLFALLVVAGPVAAANASVKIREVSDRYSFFPATSYVNVGGSVTWTNGTDAPHTVTSNSGGELGSASLAQDATYSHTFSATGTFAYHCTVHTYMTGKVVVLAAGVALPSTDTDPSAGQARTGEPLGVALAILVGVGGAGLAIRRLRRAS